jgi:hypothetical protein
MSDCPRNEPTIEGGRGLDGAPTLDEVIASIRAKLETTSPFSGLFAEVKLLLGAYDQARGEADAATAAMEAIARTSEEERAELVRERDVALERMENQVDHDTAEKVALLDRAEAAEREVAAYRDALRADPDEADALAAILLRLDGTPEQERFLRFHRDYRFALSACERANEILPDAAEAFVAARKAMEDFNAGLSVDEIPWLTKTLPGNVTSVLIEQYRRFFAGVNALNYVTLGIDADGKSMRIILCTVDGKGPHELQLEAEAERDQARAELAEAKRWNELYLEALDSIAPDGLPFQLVVDGDGGQKYPQFGIVTTWSPYIVEDQAREDGLREVSQFKYDEDSQHGELCHVGYFVDEEWLCNEAAVHEEALEDARAQAMRSGFEIARGSAEPLPSVTGDACIVWERAEQALARSISALKEGGAL